LRISKLVHSSAIALVLSVAIPLLAQELVLKTPSVAPAVSAEQRATVIANFGRTPLNFEINQGQAAPSVDAVAHGPGYTLNLSRGDASLRLDAKLPVGSTELRLQLLGTDHRAQMQKEQKQEAISNYFLGNDPGRWHTDIPNYAQIRYAGIYPGIDVLYYGNGHGLEHDFVVAPGADPEQIQMAISGAKAVRLDKTTGDMVLVTDSGEMRLHKPVTYQIINGAHKEVASRYAVAANGSVGFHLTEYDRSLSLIIDPELSYSTLAPPASGGGGPRQMAVDTHGAIYLVGTLLNSSGNYDAAIYKLTPGGSAVVYSDFFGGSGQDSPAAVTVDAWGFAYITGDTQSHDFPTLSAFQSSFQGTGSATDAFVTKINQAGNSLVFSSYLGGGGEAASAIAVDSVPRVFVTGSTTSPDFPTHLALQPALRGISNIYVTAINQLGSSVVYSTYLGGSGSDFPTGIAVDSKDDVYIAGTTTSTNFPVKNALQATNKNPSPSPNTGFLAKIYPTGSQLLYSTYLGGSLGDAINGLAIDSSGNAYVAGTTSSPDFPVANAYQASGGSVMGQIAGCGDFSPYNTAFVSKINAAGSALVYSTYLGSLSSGDTVPFGECGTSYPLENVANGIAVDSSGDAFVTGSTFSTGFPVSSDAFQATNIANNNCASSAFLTKFSPDGSTVLYSTYFSGLAHSGDEADICTGSGGSTGTAVAVDPLGSAYMLGFPGSADPTFPLTAVAYQTNFVGHFTWPYLAKFAFSPMATTTTTVSASYAQVNGSNTVILSSQVQPAAGGSMPTGTVTFVVDTAAVGSATLNGQGIATLQYTFATQGSHTVQAYYSGLINTDASTASLTRGFGITTVPAIAPAAGTYHYLPMITLSDRQSGAVIHYTIDGSTPSASSPIYSAPFQVAKTATVQAIAIAPQNANSAVVSASYVINPPAATPTFSLPGGVYKGARTVALADATAGAILYYTLDGTTPTTSSTVYSAPIVVSASKTIKAIATASGDETSSVASAIYYIQ
jgi:hypothetical protein